MIQGSTSGSIDYLPASTKHGPHNCQPLNYNKERVRLEFDTHHQLMNIPDLCMKKGKTNNISRLASLYNLLAHYSYKNQSIKAPIAKLVPVCGRVDWMIQFHMLSSNRCIDKEKKAPNHLTRLTGQKKEENKNPSTQTCTAVQWEAWWCPATSSGSAAAKALPSSSCAALTCGAQ